MIASKLFLNILLPPEKKTEEINNKKNTIKILMPSELLQYDN